MHGQQNVKAVKFVINLILTVVFGQVLCTNDIS